MLQTPFIITVSPGRITLSYGCEVNAEPRPFPSDDARRLSQTLRELHPNIPQVHRGFTEGASN